MSIWIWSLHASASSISICLHSHNFRSIFPISAFIFPHIICLLYFGAKTIWYLQFHFICAKLSVSNFTKKQEWCANGVHAPKWQRTLMTKNISLQEAKLNSITSAISNTRAIIIARTTIREQKLFDKTKEMRYNEGRRNQTTRKQKASDGF